MVTTLSQSQARRIALAAQGFLDQPHDQPTMRTFARTLERTGVLQVDSVNVLQRAHYMPLYSRMGPYDVDLLTRAAREEAAPAGRVLGARAGADAGRAVAGDAAPDGLLPRPAGASGGAARSTRSSVDQPAGRDRRPRAPSTARDLDDGAAARQGALGLELVGDHASAPRLPLHGRRASPIAGRNSQFEVSYDLPERVIPADVLAAPDADARGGRPRARPPGGAVPRRRDGPLPGRLLPDAAPTTGEAGASTSWSRRASCEPVRIEGWNRPAYLHRDARRPRRVDARALLSPFDPVVWVRERTEKLFDFHYRIEIYTPAPQAGATATTCCRSCSATRSSAGSTSRPTARRAGWS